jgi:subtilase family serine protease
MSQQFAPTVRIVDRIDENQLVTLKGNTHPLANSANDLGRVSPSLPMTDLILVLSRSPEQQAAFDQFVASEYDSTSPNFHQWLTPDQVGANFGPAETDIATISNWLTGHGFSITEVSKDRMSIRFNGTAGLVESAFHTEIHNLSVKGEAHIGNMADPQIPAALSTTVVGVKALHNFFPRPLHRMGSQVQKDAASGKWQRISSATVAGTAGLGANLVRPTPSGAATGSALGAGALAATARPQFGINVGGTSPYLVEDVAPYDFATIYDILPLWNAGIDGTGQTIAIAGTSDIDVGQTGEAGANGSNDVATFRTFFGLPTNNPANTPIRISGNSSPLTVCSSTTNTLCSQGDQVENSLDVEWSGAIAKNAQIILVASYPTSASDDNLYDSESYIVNHLTARIMNVSYGECEWFNGTAGNVQYYDLWQQAAAEGIAVFVATGDSGAASCDQGGDSRYPVPYPAEYGLSVSGLASTPWNTAVGGTDFNWCPLPTSNNSPVCTAGPYWSTTNNASAGQSTALGYVPEVPWNDTCTSPVALPFLEYFWNGGATVTDAETGCNAFVVNAQLLSNQGLGVDLYLVDTVGGSGGASGCIVSTSTLTTNGTCTSGSTSTGATTNPDTGAAQASLTLVNNGWPKPSWQTNASIPGLPSDGVRDIPDVSFFASDGFLSSSSYLICVSDVAACSYSSNSEPTAQEVGGTSVATPSMAGVMALINQKAGVTQGSPNAELYALAAKQTYSNCSAEHATTGNGCYFNDIDTGTNAMACDYSAYVTTPSLNCSRIHSSDLVGILPGYSATTGYDQATGLGSLNVTNVVKAWVPALGGSEVTVTVTPAQTNLNLSQSLLVSGTVASSPSGGATPTGAVTLTAGSYVSPATTLSNTGGYSLTIPANSLGVGTDTINVGYGGSGTYNSGSGQAVVTVSGSGATFSLNQTPIVVTPASIVPGGTATAVINLTAVAGYTGTVTLTCQESNTTAVGGDGATCSIPSTAVGMGGTATATIGTTAAIAKLVYPNVHGKGSGWAGVGGGAVLAFLVFLGIPARRRSWQAMLGVLVLMATLGSLAACGGSGGSSGGGGGGPPPDPGTTAGVYTFTVQATGNPSVTPSVSTTFTVTVN